MSSELVVLLVQPERDDRKMYAEFFRDQGWRVMAVSTAHDALRIAPMADVIITGILLPGHIDGVELIARLKGRERTRRIPVVVLTACAWDAERERAENAGCEAFLSKPCLPSDLVGTVGRVLALRRVPKPQSVSMRPAEASRIRRKS
jgi:two-component system, cell cycle response regulator DivK